MTRPHIRNTQAYERLLLSAIEQAALQTPFSREQVSEAALSLTCSGGPAGALVMVLLERLRRAERKIAAT